VKKDFLGQPVWLWAVGAVVVIGGYLYFTRHTSQPAAGAAAGQGGQAGGKSTSTSSFQEWITQHQGGPSKSKPKPKPQQGGPERQWLIKKTGSQHPWTFLQRHHETIAVGPHGSRTIVHKKR
jgi:hypothetical protein